MFGKKDKPKKTVPEVLYSIEHFSSTADDDGLVWVHGFPYKTYKHPLYGDVSFTPEDAKTMVDNFTAGVLGRDVSWNYDHGEDRSKGNKAAAWVRKLDIRDDGLYVGVEPTAEAMSEIEDGQWKYSSIERRREWEHPETGEVFQNVLVGGAFTNRPFMHGIEPLNFSEYIAENVVEEQEREPEGNKQEDEVDLRELAKSVGMDENASEKEVFSRIAAIQSDAEKFRENDKVKVSGIERFKEEDPELYAELMEARKDRRENKAEKFADGMKTEDGKILSPEWRTKVVDAHRKLQNQEIPVEEFSTVVGEAAVKGLVRIGTEKGKASTQDKGDADPVKQVQEFREKAAKKSRDRNISIREAYAEVAQEEPELYKAYEEFNRPQLIEA